MKTHLERLRAEAMECALISKFETDNESQELFARLAEHLNLLADHVEVAIAMKTREASGGTRIRSRTKGWKHQVSLANWDKAN